jgi:malonyl CoA-acyl carrier protein transacylase/phosphopantetheinyl transferase
VAAQLGLAAPVIDTASLESTGVGVIEVSRLLLEALRRAGVAPDAICGHSIGEWSGMLASGMIPPAAADELVAHARGGTVEIPDVAFGAAGCGAARAAEAMTGLDGIAISHDNCPHQVIFCGREASVDAALARLVAAGVLCQKLPFRSGFHSPLFGPFAGAHEANFRRLPIVPAAIPLFSATTCAPYPGSPEEIRALATRHLVEPVRFRELIEALHDRGARVFVQVGTGSLPGFIEDTLRGRPHLAISANVPTKTGMEQLRALLISLWVEGAAPRFEAIGLPSPPRSEMSIPLGAPLRSPGGTPSVAPKTGVAAAFQDVLDEIVRAQADVARSMERSGPREATTIRTLSVDTHPELVDHTFFRQPPGWPVLSDRHPVVPMTALIELFLDAARSLVPGKVAIGVDDVQAFRWLVVSRPIDVKIIARTNGDDRVSVTIDGYASGTVRMADAYPPAPSRPTPPAGRPAPIPAARLYEDRFMFHGPAYQGVVELGPVGDASMSGVLTTPPAIGALLDNAGQLFGYWVMLTSERDRLAMPVQIRKLRFFGPHPRAGARLDCDVRITKVGERDVHADLTLSGSGRVWAAIEDWEDRRFDTDERLWPVMIWPEKNLLAEPQDGGWVRFVDRYRAAPTRDQLARRFLGERERALYEAQGPRQQRAWLSGRIAAKDAIRTVLGDGIFPVEIEVLADEAGRPTVNRDVRVSIAHKDELAVAYAVRRGEPGIDVERIEPRPASFAEVAFERAELALIAAGDDRDEWLTRLWAAKEAAGKARGTGLGGNPRRLRIVDRAGDRLLTDGIWVSTRRDGDHIVAWCVA